MGLELDESSVLSDDPWVNYERKKIKNNHISHIFLENGYIGRRNNMQKICNLCIKYHIEIKIEYDDIIDAVIFSFYDRQHNIGFRYSVRKTVIYAMKSLESLEDYIYEKVIEEFDLEKKKGVVYER